MSLKVNFKMSGSGGSTFSLDLEPSLTVEEVKCMAMEPSGVEPTQMKIIFKGRILKDVDTMESVQVTSGSTMHIVKSAPSTNGAQPVATPAASAGATPTAAPAPVTTAATAPAMTQPTPGMPGMGGMMADPAMMQAAMQMMGGTGGGAPNLGTSPMGGMEGLMQNPEMMMQMMQNPMVQQMMQNMAQNPQMLQAMIQNNPMLQQMSQNNPMMQQMLSNPQLLQTMMNPQFLQGMMQMQQAMGGMGAPGAPQTPALTGGPPAANPANPMMQMMQGMQGMQGMPGMPGMAGLPNPADTRPAEERFAVQAQQLESMGFPDKHSNLQALTQTNGDVNEAINALLAGA